MTRRRRWILGVGGLVVLLALGFWAVPVPSEALKQGVAPSLRLTDRHGTVLREFLSSDEGTSAWVDLDRISPDLVTCTLAAEDHRFWSHLGVDPIGVLRAAVGNARAGHVVSGASTLAMQWIGNATNHHPRTLGGKAWQGLQAMRLMTMLSRRELLERYLNTVPYGHQTFGAEAAARFYFNRSANSLSLAQCAWLAAIPAAPAYFDGLAEPDRVRGRERDILAALQALGWVPSDRLAAAEAELVRPFPDAAGWRAPYFCDHLRDLGHAQTTLDLGVQHLVEGILRQRLASLQDRHVTNGAVVVLDNASGDVLAWVGGVDYRTSQVDDVLSLRQPGSTLKPFLYGLAMEQGWTTATLLPDLPYRYGGVKADYLPANYDNTWHGPVPLRQALACSYNAPAVYVLDHLGTRSLLDRLHLVGFDSLTQNADHYGLGLTLGDGEVTLLELANAYRTLANGGVYRSVHLWPQPMEEGRTVYSPRVAWLLSDILSDPTARLPAFGRHSVLDLPFPCGAKTGTSQDFRDNWTVGYTTEVTVAVWVGNNDGSRLQDVSGVTGAGGVFRDVMEAVTARFPAHPFERPEGLVALDICPDSGELAAADCPTHVREWFMQGYRPRGACRVHRLQGGHVVAVYPPELAQWRREAGLALDPGVTSGIESPEDGEVLRLDPVLRREAQALHLSVLAPPASHTVRWYVDGTLYRTVPAPYVARWPLVPGTHTFRAVTATWQSAPVHVTVH